MSFDVYLRQFYGSERVREGVYLIICDSLAQGGTSRVKIYGCFMLESREKEVVLERVAAGENKRNKLIQTPLAGLAWLVGFVDQAQSKRREKNTSNPFRFAVVLI